VRVASTLQHIGAHAFSFSGIRSLDLANTVVEEIGEAAFYYCLGINSIQFPITLLSIGKFAFTTWFALETVDLSSTALVTIRCGTIAL
jgi:hypothetical protein